jgi:membrane dipeptidase
MVALEGGRLIENDLDRIYRLKEMGIKYLTLTHNRNNKLGDSATDIHVHGGLTSLGKAVIKLCEAEGIFIDVSHASLLTLTDVLNYSSKPVIATHSAAFALVKNKRNLPNWAIEGIANSGGVIGIPFAKRFLGCHSLGEHIDHIGQFAGPNHIGIGSDIDGAQLIPSFTSLSSWEPTIRTSINAVGVSEANQAKLLGENWMNLFKE